MKRFNELREATMSTWTVTVQKPVNKLKKGDKQVVKARSAFEAINKAVKLWKDPALKSAPIASFKITKEGLEEEIKNQKIKKGDKVLHKDKGSRGSVVKSNTNGTVDVLWKFSKSTTTISTDKIIKESVELDEAAGKMKRNPAIDNNPDVKAARKAHADGTWDGNVDKEGEAIVHIKGKPYTVTNNNESVKEGKMKELQDYIDQGKSAEWIAKKIGYPVKDVKDFLKGYQKESVDEAKTRKYRVKAETGPHQTDEMEIDATSRKQAETIFRKSYRHPMNLTVELIRGVKEDIDEGVDKSSDVYKEYLLLKKKSIADLRKMVGQSQRGAVDLKSYDKQGAISDLLRNKFGGKKVDAAMGLSEAYKKGDKVTVKNAKKYDAFSKPEVSGVVMGVTKDGVQVKVGTGSMTVDPKDIKESLEEAVRSHPKGYDRLSSSEYSKAKKNKNFSKDDWAWDNKVDLYTRVTNEDLDEAFYKAGSEKSKLDSGYRSHLKDDEGKTAYIGNVSYKKADTAKGEAEVYGDAYYKTAGKSGNERAADKAIAKYRQKHSSDIVESALTFSAMREAQLSPGEYIKTYKKSTGKSVADPVQFRKTKFAILKNKKPLVLKGKEAVVVGQGNAEKAVAELQARDPKSDYKAMRTESIDEAIKIGTKVTITKGEKSLIGINGRVGEIRKDPAGNKTFTIDYQDAKGQRNSVQVPRKNIKELKESLEEAVSPIVKSTAVGRKNLLKVNAEVVKLMALSDDKTMKKYYADILKQLNWADGRLKQLGKPE